MDQPSVFELIIEWHVPPINQSTNKGFHPVTARPKFWKTATEPLQKRMQDKKVHRWPVKGKLRVGTRHFLNDFHIKSHRKSSNKNTLQDTASKWACKNSDPFCTLQHNDFPTARHLTANSKSVLAKKNSERKKVLYCKNETMKGRILVRKVKNNITGIKTIEPINAYSLW